MIRSYLDPNDEHDLERREGGCDQASATSFLIREHRIKVVLSRESWPRIKPCSIPWLAGGFKRFIQVVLVECVRAVIWCLLGHGR